MSPARFPRWVYGEGGGLRSLVHARRPAHIPLAWIRTALAMTAGGVALEALAIPMLPGLRLAASLLLLALGLAVPVLAWTGSGGRGRGEG